MDNELEGARGGVFPFDKSAIADARSKLAPPTIGTIKELYGKITVGSAHPTGDFETTVDDRPTISLDDKPTPSDESPPSVEEALARKAEVEAKAPKSYTAGKRYQVIFNKRVEVEPEFWLSPHEVHTIDGALASKHKAHIDAAAEVAE